MNLDLVLPLLLLLAVAAGLVGSLTGLGGAVVVIPALILLFGVPVPVAIGTGPSRSSRPRARQAQGTSGTA